MKGTRLWQETRSPLISGRSKRERPFWREVLGAWTIAVLLVAAFAVAVASPGEQGTVSVSGIEVPAVFMALLGGSSFAVLPALIGSVTGTWVARKMGWRRPWVAGAALGLLFGLLWLALSAIELGRR